MARKKLSKESRNQHKGEEPVEKEEKPMESTKTLKEMETLNKNLKSLNQILAKETMEKRFQIENLRAEVEELSGEAPLRSDIERGICRLVVSSALAEGISAAAAEREEAGRQARNGESAFESLRERMEEEREEAERRSAELRRAVNAKCGLEAEVRVLKEEEEGLRSEVADLLRRNGELEKNVGILVKEKEKTSESLEMHTKESAVKLAEWKEKIERVEREKEGLGMEIVGLEKRNGEFEKEIGRLLADVNGLEKEKEENEMRFEAKIRESALELDDLRGRMCVIVREKDAIERTNANREAEIGGLKREVTKLNLSLSKLKELEKTNGELEGEIGRLLGSVSGLEKEKEESEMRYEAKIRDSMLKSDDLRARMGVIVQEKDAIEEAKANREAEILELKKEVMKLNLNLSVLQELEKRNGELEGEIGRLLGSVNGLEKEKEENEMRYKAKIRDLALESDDLRARMGVIVQEKDAIEEAKANMEAEILELKKEVMKLNLNLPVLQELEKRNGELEGEIGRLLLIVSGLEKEKEEKETRFETMVRESASELDDLKERMRAIVLQKDAMETSREVEILELKKEATKLNSSLLELQELSRVYHEKNAQLQVDLDAAERELDTRREDAGCLKLQVDKLTESRDGTLQEFKDLKLSFDSLLSEKEEGKRSIKLLSEQKSSLEKSLSVAQANCRDMEGKVAVAEATSAKALSLVKATVEAVNGSVKARENGAIDDDEDERIRPFAGELETIKTAHYSRVTKMEEMNRELEVIKSAVEEATKKKAGLWMWLYPAATTFLAAVSFAYAAKAR